MYFCLVVRVGNTFILFELLPPSVFVDDLNGAEFDGRVIEVRLDAKA